MRWPAAPRPIASPPARPTAARRSTWAPWPRDGPVMTGSAGGWPATGIICVAWQQLSVGKHHSGEVVDVHVTGRLLEVWSANDLIKTAVRTSRGEIRKKRAERTAQPLH